MVRKGGLTLRQSKNYSHTVPIAFFPATYQGMSVNQLQPAATLDGANSTLKCDKCDKDFSLNAEVARTLG
jgi:hypothetical protein